jgi:GT2 family glycosyltransferase
VSGRIKVIDVELDAPAQPLGDMDGYQGLRALVRLHGTPVGYVEVPVVGTDLTEESLKRIIVRRLARPIIRHHLRDILERPLPPDGISLEELLDVAHPSSHAALPLMTIAVCTRDRTEDLRLCLDALARLDYPHLDILVIDNAPSDDSTARLLRESYPQVRYVREPRPGLDWARNRAIAEARGEIIAYTDDDVIVDTGWATALARAFEDPRVMAVTGLVVPYEFETEPQILFEQYGGFGRGFQRLYWRMDREGGEGPFPYLGAGKYGTGANMAYRRSLFERIGPFDPALDVGTVTNGGGDLEMFFRVLKHGCLLAYEPNAIVRHRHRRDYARLHTQLANNGIGFYSHLVCNAMAYPDTRADATKFAVWWFWRHNMSRLVTSFVPLNRPMASPVRRPRFPRDLILAEFWGSLRGLVRYPKARRHAARIALSYKDEMPTWPHLSAPAQEVATKQWSVGVRTVDLCNPLRGLEDVNAHAAVRVYVELAGRPIGYVEIPNHHQPLSAARLRDAIVNQLDLKLLREYPTYTYKTVRELAEVALRQHYLSDRGAPSGVRAQLADDVPVSIVVATYDRPGDLRDCLRCLTRQESARQIEIVVVDNHPASGLTPPVVAEFPGVMLVAEPRQGLSYARNKGFAVSRGEIVIATDDDVLAPTDWLEKLVAPFARPDVMVVTGNTLPFELESDAQRLFERYGGLGKGFAPKEADGAWFDSFRRRAVPTWELGATANAAFRASIFSHPDIGLLDEALGAGTPAGCSEDTYLFYKVLKVGYTIAYEQTAFVWHKHRCELSSLHSQIYNYSKGHVAYHLTTLLRDQDVRALNDLAIRLPRWHLIQLARYARWRVLGGRYHWPLGIILEEIKGHVAGPAGLWRARRRVQREGRSAPPASGREVIDRKQQLWSG